MKQLEITTNVGCINKCWYCPQQKFLEAYKSEEKILFFENFKKILLNVSSDVVISFSGFSEPFLNSEASRMMKYSIESGYVTDLYTTLVGFSNSDKEILRGLKFNNLYFHYFLKKDLNGKIRQEKSEYFKEKVNSFLKDITYSDYNILNFHYNNTPIIFSRAGSVFTETDKIGTFTCKKDNPAFFNNILLPNGDIYLCCMDWSLKHKLGNLFETTFDDLNRNEIIKLSQEDKSEIICRKCECFKKLNLDNHLV